MKNSFTLPFTLRVKKVVYSLQSHVLLLGLIGLVGFVGSVYSIQKSKIVLLSEPSVNHTKYSPSPTNSVMNTSQFRPLLKKAELMANPSGVTTTPTVVWNSFFQGTAQAVTSLVEGGYVAAGYTYSTLYNKSSYNFIVVRVDEKGKLLWQKILGGSTTEYAYAVVQTTDGGIIVAGQTDSNDGDVSGNHGLSDGWLVKLDKDGNLVWTKAIGGSSAEFIMGLTALADGGVMGAGWGYSTDGNRSGGHGSSDFWVFRMDADGNVIWSKSFGGYYDDHADAITSLKYGQFAVFGYTYSNDGDVSGNHGSADYWVIKIDFNGQLIWQKALGGSATDWGWGGIVTSADDGLVMAGLTYSNDGDVSGSHSPTNTDLNGTMDYWVVKLNNDGQLIWQRVLGGSADDRPEGTMATSDGGYIVAGQSKSNDGDVSGNHGNGDAWLVKLNDNGNLQWQKPMGGSGEDFAWAVAGLSASSFVIAGTSNSTDGDINQTHDNNFWLAKLETPASSTPLTLVAPNYNCQTGAFHFNTSGGDGSPIEYRAIPGITDWTTNPDQFVDKESRTAVDVKPFRLEARQRGTIVTYSWDLRAYCDAQLPLQLLSPSYDCQSGAIHFNTRGGDGSPIEFMAIGITGWTTNPNQYVDRESRTASDVQPFTLLARQGGVTVSYVWDLKVACGRARIALDEKSSRLNVVIMGNPLEGQTADIEIQGVEGKTVGLKLVDQQGHILHKYTVPKANLIERVQIPIGNSKGLLLLEVTTDTERQQLKMIKP